MREVRDGADTDWGAGAVRRPAGPGSLWRETVIVERSGKPMVAMIPVETYERLVAEREARFAVLERIRGRLPEVPEEEVERDVAEAVAAVRAARGAAGASSGEGR